MPRPVTYFFVFIAVLLGRPAVWAQVASPAQPPVEMTAEEDHRRMMDLLGISELRPGPSGNPSAPNAANTDESRATTYSSLPDPLRMEDGTAVATAQAWWSQRRPEIEELFDREIYGRVPDDVPDVRWVVEESSLQTYGGVPVRVKKLVGRVDNSAYPLLEVNIDLTVVTPAEAKEPVPVMMQFGWVFPPGMRFPGAPRGPRAMSWQDQLLANGWGYAILVPTSFQADNGAGLTKGIIGLTNHGQPRDLDHWGTLRAWAWGASRALDYLETDRHVDASQVGIEGLSRYGKAAIVAMAYEPRLKIGFIGSSGAGGAKILRRIFGEQVENLASSAEYHWFAGNFIKYAGPLDQNDLPVDAHQLVAMAAPRPVFISVGSPTVEGQWIDARGMFLAGVHAGPVYELLGARGLGATEMPPIATGLVDGEIAFRQHRGGHTTGPNWPTFLRFAERYITTPFQPAPWVGSWATSVQLVEPRNLPPEPGLTNNTLRQVVRPTLGGDRIRVKFSSAFSSEPVTLRAVRIAPSLGEGRVDPTAAAILRFDGAEEVTIGPGMAVSSDPISFDLEPLQDVAITIHFGATSPDVTGHPGSRTTSYLATGDQVDAADLSDAPTAERWYVIAGIDVVHDSAGAIVTLGNSITDGRGSGTDRQNRWPDELARRLQTVDRTRNVAVLNAGIGGNCVLRDCLGPAAIDRFQRDVHEQPNVRWLIILEGVNDIGGAHPDSADAVADRLIEAFGQMVGWAHSRDVKAYGATILPFGESFYDAPQREVARQKVNDWIRSSGVFDAVIDFDAALRDPAHPSRLREEADTGDHLHPNETGYRMMAEAIDLALFRLDAQLGSTAPRGENTPGPRVRRSINRDWRVPTDDPPGLEGQILYDAPPETGQAEDDRPADAAVHGFDSVAVTP